MSTFTLIAGLFIQTASLPEYQIITLADGLTYNECHEMKAEPKLPADHIGTVTLLCAPARKELP